MIKNNIVIKQKYGRLIALKNIGVIKGCTYFKCKCDCGNIIDVCATSLKTGHTKSCGCLQKEVVARLNTKHGMSATKTYITWEAMIRRCYSEKSARYKYYGGRGITVCQEWRDSFETFYNDMGKRPENQTIDRINNDLGYFKENCQWATSMEQSHNRRLSRRNKTGIPGVDFMKRKNKYRARINANNESIHLGLFLTIKEAAEARQAAESKYW